ncbi:D-2-hydroxyacid dehydrogenase [Novosphingobium sp. JCM 18896]|uniref:D-2-hydroxyacid dehydrogenase n=1 Tax=Novosphingobium sp. JCM 18896 TaxID=2989731 RepID=UPI002222218B|nr:D-2-hydroxyacid dehydrogenase [Novosphingobium sp. JCM 18896]MCW1427959.1 D-2-hydroxyacid dehydrogenase [Novosphingobium sp. JCM 18896]
MTVALLNAMLRPLLESRLPGWVEPRWFDSSESLLAGAPEAEIGWFDAFQFDSTGEALARAEKLRWVSTVAAGIDHLPLAMLAERGVALTNGAGLNSITIAEFAVMGMLTIAKDYRAIVHAQDRREWLFDAPGKMELYGSKALILGAGGIGTRIAELLAPFGVAVTMARRTPAPGALGPDEWRERLGEFDWVIVAVASTAETRHMVGQAEFAAMKPGATVMNFSRGFVIDTQALLDTLRAGRLGAAYLDVTDPEPLPADHPLWGFDNVHITMHLSGRAQNLIMQRGADRFLANLDRYARGEPLLHRVDLALGY